MKTWNQRLKNALDLDSDLNQNTLAVAVGVKPPTVTDWLNGKIKSLTAENAHAICAVLNIRMEWLLKGKLPMRPGGKEDKSQLERRGKVPVISWTKAGQWCESPNEFEPGDAEEWLDCPFPHSDGSFYLILIGDSMSPAYQEGEYILVDPNVQAAHGKDVVVRTPSGTYTFKRLQITPEGTYLLALNPDHPERKIKIPDDSHICGVVTASLRKR